MGRRGIKRTTSDLIRHISITFKNKPFTKDDIELSKRSMLGPLSSRGYVSFNTFTNTYVVTPAGHKYVQLFTGD